MNTRKKISEHYDGLAQQRQDFIQKNAYYHEMVYKDYRYLIPQGKRVLEVGCGTGHLLDAVNPSIGVGIDISPKMIELAKDLCPKRKFIQGDISSLSQDATFDYIILSGLLGELEDIKQFFIDLKSFCHEETRIIIQYYSGFWQYALKVCEKAKWKMPQQIQNWVTYGDVYNFLELTGYQPIKKERGMLLPKKIWLLSTLVNRWIARLPIFNALTLNHFIIARPLFKTEEEKSISIVIPCRNEKGNIEAAITRTPEFGSRQEFIFVEGGSKDGTAEEVQRVIRSYPDKNIRLFRQTGKGKGDAVRLGFSKATGEILMILDADLTVPPEDLPKFYHAIQQNRAEFINGCRLVYPMEKEAMRFLNLLANKCFGVFFSWLLGQRYKDTLCGTKVLSKAHYDEIAANRAYFGDFDPFGDFDLIFGATKINLKVLELPIRYRERTYGSTQIQRFRHGLLLFRMCFFAMRKIKFR